MARTRKNYRNKGGKVIASGGYGCVFDPALKCEGSSKRDSNKISKLILNYIYEFELNLNAIICSRDFQIKLKT